MLLFEAVVKVAVQRFLQVAGWVVGELESNISVLVIHVMSKEVKSLGYQEM